MTTQRLACALILIAIGFRLYAASLVIRKRKATEPQGTKHDEHAAFVDLSWAFTLLALAVHFG